MEKEKKILITGANGYIGQHVVNELIYRGIEVIAVDLSTNGLNKKARLIDLDIFSGEKGIFTKIGSPDVCLHLAWKDGFMHNSDTHMEFLSKHYRFVKEMINAGLKHIAIMGSMHEIGYYEGPIDENTPCNPISMYGIAKNALRRSVSLLSKNSGIIFQWLRAFYIYGDDERNHSIFTKLLQAEQKGQKSFPFTSGKHKYDFIHIRDLSKMISNCILQNEIDGVINCCSGEPISLGEKVEKFIQENKLRIKLDYGVFPDRPYDSPGIWGDNSKISKINQNNKTSETVV